MNNETNVSMESESNSLNSSKSTNMIIDDQNNKISLEKKKNEDQFEQKSDHELKENDKENISDQPQLNLKRNKSATTASLKLKVFIANIKSKLSSTMLNIIESVPKYTRSIVHSDTFGYFIFDKLTMPNKSSSSNDIKKLQINPSNFGKTSLEIDNPIKVN